MTTKSVTSCQFRRTKEDQWENGMAVLDHVGGSPQIIIPASGTSPADVLYEVYDYANRPERGTLTFEGE